MKKNIPIADCHKCGARNTSVFCGLNGEELEELDAQKRCTIYKKGQIIFKENSFPHGLYCINSGKTKLYQTAEKGREQIVRLAKDGDLLGYRTLLSDDKYTSTCEAIEVSSICFIPRTLFMQLVEKNATISINIMKLLSSDLKKAEHKVTDLAQKPVRERMAEAILFIKETYGFEKDNATINVVFTREEIANIAGTATETAIRILSDFKEERLVEFVGKKIKIVNQKELIHVANVVD